MRRPSYNQNQYFIVYTSVSLIRVSWVCRWWVLIYHISLTIDKSSLSHWCLWISVLFLSYTCQTMPAPFNRDNRNLNSRGNSFSKVSVWQILHEIYQSNNAVISIWCLGLDSLTINLLDVDGFGPFLKNFLFQPHVTPSLWWGFPKGRFDILQCY